jgi:hypothetical protein
MCIKLKERKIKQNLVQIYDIYWFFAFVTLSHDFTINYHVITFCQTTIYNVWAYLFINQL